MRAAKIITSILIFTVLVLSFQQYQIAHADTLSLESNALAYVKNVLPFDMNHYAIIVSNAYCLSAPNDLTITQAVEIDLKSNDSTIHVVCVYVNGALHQCGITPTSGSPVSDRSYANLKDIATRILQAHQEQTGLDSTDLLDTLTLLNDTIISAKLGDITLTVSQFPDIVGFKMINNIPVPIASNSSFSVSFAWMRSVNGTPSHQVTLTFDKGILRNLQDERAIDFMADTDSNISKEQAMTPTPPPVAASKELNSESQAMTSQSTNRTGTQTTQLPSESSVTHKTADTQNGTIILRLIAAVATYVTVIILVITYETKNQENKIKKEVSKRD